MRTYEQSRALQLSFAHHIRAANYDAAAAEIEAALASRGLHPLEAASLEYQLAQLYAGMENHARAIRILERSITRRAAQTRHEAYSLLANLYHGIGQHERAIAVMEQGLELSFQDSGGMATYYQTLVDLYVGTQRTDRARAALGKMITLFSGEKSYREQLHALDAMLE